MESGNVDTDTWNGMLEDLQAFVNKVVIPHPLTKEERVELIEQKLAAHGW
jgi:hypothetical protein